MYRKDSEGKQGKRSPALLTALRVLGEVLPEPETTNTKVVREVPKKKSQPLRLITITEFKELDLQAACPHCLNGCTGGSDVEVNGGVAAACRPTEQGIVQLRVGFTQGFKPEQLFCLQPKVGEIAVRIDLGTRIKTVSKCREKQSV